MTDDVISDKHVYSKWIKWREYVWQSEVEPDSSRWGRQPGKI